MSEPYNWGDGVVPCPYCKAPDQEGEDLGDHPAYLSYTCLECDKDFSVNTMLEEYYDGKGNVIKCRLKN